MNEYNNRKGLITTPIQGRGEQIEQEMSLLGEEEMSAEEQEAYMYEEWRRKVAVEAELTAEYYDMISK